jgi:N-acetylmuramoyl-L-alanine amidase
MAFLKDSEYTLRKKTVAIVIHCSDTLPSMDIGAEEIRGWHIRERGWKDIGYNGVIRRDGTYEPGRPTWAIGAHVEGHNSTTVSVCLVGGRGKKGWENNFTPAQWKTLKTQVLPALLGRYGAETEVKGHRDFPGVDKKCPSFDVPEWWKKNRAEVLARVG